MKPGTLEIKSVTMKPFWRVFGYVKQEYRAVILSIVCALLTVFLFALSITAVLPLMKVMIGEEGLHDLRRHMFLEYISKNLYSMCFPRISVNRCSTK